MNFEEDKCVDDPAKDVTSIAEERAHTAEKKKQSHSSRLNNLIPSACSTLSGRREEFNSNK